MTDPKLTKADLHQFTGSEHWYRYVMARDILYTDGANPDSPYESMNLAQRCFSSRPAHEMTTDLQRSQPNAGAKIKQACQHPGIEHAQQQFRERRAGAEQQRRGQGKKNSGCCYVRMIAL